MQWIITEITEITEEYVQQNMPEGTTHIVFPAGAEIGIGAFEDCTRLDYS